MIKKIIFSILILCLSFFCYSEVLSKKTEEDENKFDKYNFDLGIEPDVSISSTYILFKYNWNNNVSSGIKGTYSSSTETADYYEGYESTTIIDKYKEFKIDFLSLIYSLEFINKIQISYSIGTSYQYIFNSTFAGMFDVNGLMLDPGDEGKYFTMNNKKYAHIISPQLGVVIRIPSHKNFIVNFDLYMNPIYFFILNQEMRYYSDQKNNIFDYGGQNKLKRWSYPYLSVKFYADCFNFTRFVTQFSYQRLDFQQMDWSEDFNRLIGYDDIQKITNFRIGIELLSGSRNRVKSGIYYQHEWNESSYSKNISQKGKWIIGIGSEI